MKYAIVFISLLMCTTAFAQNQESKNDEVKLRYSAESLSLNSDLNEISLAGNVGLTAKSLKINSADSALISLDRMELTVDGFKEIQLTGTLHLKSLEPSQLQYNLNTERAEMK